MAMKSGMLAAETILESLLKNDFSDEHLKRYREALLKSYVADDLYRVRNFHQSLQRGGLYFGGPLVGVQWVLGGSFLEPRLISDPDFLHLKKVRALYGTDSPTDEMKGDMKYDGERTFDKETDVYY